MNNSRASETEHRSLQILNELSGGDSVTQRDLSKRLGIALGLVNSYIRNLAAKGYITVRNIPPRRYAYYLTPKGFAEKTRLTYELLHDYTRIYREARRNLKKLFRDLGRAGVKRVIFAGADEVAEIAYITLKETSIELACVADIGEEGKDFCDHRVIPVGEIPSVPHDHVVLTSYLKRKELYNALLVSGVPADRISILWELPSAPGNNPEEPTKGPHVIWHKGQVGREDRNNLNRHKSGLVWFTGLSASGKSTIAHGVELELFSRGIRAYVLDGDNIRHGLNCNLGFSPEDRKENLRRVAEVAKLFSDAGILVLAAFISPFREDREYIRERFHGDNFFEIYVKCPIEICEDRDPKGQYKKARAGIISNYTGISAPYEEPGNPDLVIETDLCDIESAILKVVELLDTKKLWRPEDKKE